MGLLNNNHKKGHKIGPSHVVTHLMTSVTYNCNSELTYGRTLRAACIFFLSS